MAELDSTKNVQKLARFRDSLSFAYFERCVIEQEHKAIAVFDKEGKVSVPCANLSVLMLGPGTRVTHSAMRTLASNGCLTLFVGEGGVRCYASALGKTRGASRLLHQARLVTDDTTRMAVVRRMYEMRFGEKLEPGLKLQQIRGREGARVRAAYARWSDSTGVEWKGRDYSRQSWFSSDPINRALSAANSCLYGICHAAILAAGYSPGLGFIHTGKMLSFVYDIADLYKTEISVPVAFHCAAEGPEKVDSRVRHQMRNWLHDSQLLKQIVPDIHQVLGYLDDDADSPYDAPDDPPGSLWDPDGDLEGGVNYLDVEEAYYDGGDDYGERAEELEGGVDPLDA